MLDLTEHQLIYLTVQACILSFVWINIVTEQGMILDFVPAFFHFLPDFLFKPLFQCAVCLSFWVFWLSVLMYSLCFISMQILLIIHISADVLFLSYLLSYANSNNK